MRSAFSKPIAAVTFPGTTVMARTSNSGELSASISASASSVPGSVSMIIFFAAEAGIASAIKIASRGGRRVQRRKPESPTNSRFFICQRKD